MPFVAAKVVGTKVAAPLSFSYAVMPTAPLDSGQAKYLTPGVSIMDSGKRRLYEYDPTAKINRDCGHRV